MIKFRVQLYTIRSERLPWSTCVVSFSRLYLCPYILAIGGSCDGGGSGSGGGDAYTVEGGGVVAGGGGGTNVIPVRASRPG